MPEEKKTECEEALDLIKQAAIDQRVILISTLEWANDNEPHVTVNAFNAEAVYDGIVMMAAIAKNLALNSETTPYDVLDAVKGALTEMDEDVTFES